MTELYHSIYPLTLPFDCKAFQLLPQVPHFCFSILRHRCSSLALRFLIPPSAAHMLLSIQLPLVMEFQASFEET